MGESTGYIKIKLDAIQNSGHLAAALVYQVRGPAWRIQLRYDAQQDRWECREADGYVIVENDQDYLILTLRG